MKEEIIARHSRDNRPEMDRSDWARVEAMTEAEIEAAAWSDPDARPMDVDAGDFGKRSALFYYPRQLARLNLDPDILAWFQGEGEDYAVRIGAVLQAYREAHSTVETAEYKPQHQQKEAH